MKYVRLMSSGGSVSAKKYTLEDAVQELKSDAIVAVVSPTKHSVILSK